MIPYCKVTREKMASWVRHACKKYPVVYDAFLMFADRSADQVKLAGTWDKTVLRGLTLKPFADKNLQS